MRKTKLFFLMLIAIVIPIYAGDGKYDFASLYSQMLKNNNRLEMADQSIYDSQLTVKDAKALYQPTIGYSLYGLYMANPPIDKISMSVGTLLGQAGLTSGSQGTGLENVDLNRYVTLYDGMENTYYGASLTLTQPLITWGKIPLSVKLAKTSSSVSELAKSDLIRQLETELNISLHTLYYIDQIYALLDEAQNDSDELVEIANEANINGIMSSQDVLDAKIQAEEITVQRAELDSKYNNILQSLRSLVGISDLERDEISFEPETGVLERYRECDVDQLKALATSSSSYQLQIVNKKKAASEIQESLAWRSVYGVPDILLNVSAGYGGSRFPFAEIGWLQEDDWSVNVSVVVSGNIWDGGKRINSINRAKSSQVSADISYDSAVDTLESAVEMSYNAMNLALAKYDYQLLKKENGDLKLDKIKIEVENGQKSKKDILNEELEIIKNDVDLLTSQITIVENVFMLDYLTNQ